MNTNQSVIALDVGDKKIGVARASLVAKLPEPLDVLNNDKDFISNIQRFINEHNAIKLVIGIPRNLEGRETAQSQKIRNFTEDMKKRLGIEIEYVDESLSTKRAEKYLKSIKKDYSLDSISACYILEEFFNHARSRI